MGYKNRRAVLPGRMSCKTTKPGFLIFLLFCRFTAAPFCFVRFSFFNTNPSDWLERSSLNEPFLLSVGTLNLNSVKQLVCLDEYEQCLLSQTACTDCWFWVRSCRRCKLSCLFVHHRISEPCVFCVVCQQLDKSSLLWNIHSVKPVFSLDGEYSITLLQFCAQKLYYSQAQQDLLSDSVPFRTNLTRSRNIKPDLD